MSAMRFISAGWCALGMLLIGSLSTQATELYRDTTVTDGGLNMGATELFLYGPVGAPGQWSFTNVTVNGNQAALLVAEGGTGNGAHGASIHLAYPEGFAEHGPLTPGNVLRLSCWLTVDPSNPINRQDWQFALLKFEFFNEPLGDPHANPDSKMFDSDQDTLGDLVTSYADGLATNAWRRFSLEYTIDADDVDLAQLKEVRPVIVQGDFTGNAFTGNVLIDDIRVEVFKDQAEAGAHPRDDETPPPPPRADSP